MRGGGREGGREGCKEIMWKERGRKDKLTTIYQAKVSVWPAALQASQCVLTLYPGNFL